MRKRLWAVFAVAGPGLLAGLSDDDPAGITTYSVLGADHGYRLLWVLLASTVALIMFHNLAARLGVVTGQGMAGLIRQQYGVRAGVGALAALVVANVGTTVAEFAGIAAGWELFGVRRQIAVPLTALIIIVLVRRGSFRIVERVLLALSAVFVSYIVAGFLAGPDWGAAATGLVVPTMPLTRDAVYITVATIGTTLAPWGLSFVQSYVLDKHLTPHDLRASRYDLVTGSVLTGVIGLFVVVACAATLHKQGHTITDAADAAAALRPLAGDLAGTVFAIGLIGSAMLAAAILPLSTGYSVTDVFGRPAALNDTPRADPLFYGTTLTVTVLGAALVLIPGAPLVPILVGTQILNAVALPPLLIYLYRLGRDRDLMGPFATGRRMATAQFAMIVALSFCVLALLFFSFL
ncbi:NRAMP family divalent metal transporter [Longispora fulva]|uniref:NRAMP (Natural resistance-associated macrophage protein)-like metal ion transporter n=1 Tax=Longispora fulva TaxID=619741 RepID=A0A8J7G5Y5_9ACTN|nr:divalent metal cation transporter [Longispora fulva]MBG6134283.1 NRAMP (natural resistance-associated macrophage protein)-like metal ion transporter [Longispora fulva]